MFQQGSSVDDICTFLSRKIEQAGLSKKLTIIDPYALAYNINDAKMSDINPTDVLTCILTPFIGQFETLELIIGSQNKNFPEQHRTVLEQNLQIEVKVLRAPSFHDRFWIVDGRLAFVVGASITGFSKKHFFIQNSYLDSDDTQALLDLYFKGAK